MINGQIPDPLYYVLPKGELTFLFIVSSAKLSNVYFDGLWY